MSSPAKLNRWRHRWEGPRSQSDSPPIPNHLRPIHARERRPRPRAAPDAPRLEDSLKPAGRIPQFRTMFGAGTIIDVRSGSPSLPSGTLSRSPGPRETGPYRKSSTPRAHRYSLATAAIGGSHHTLPGAGIPPWYASLRPGLSSGAFGLLTAPLTASTNGSSASGQMPLGAAGGSKAEFDFSVDRFPGQGRQMASPGGGLGLSAPDTTVGPASKPCW